MPGLTSFHREDLRAVQRGDITITSAGFVFDDNVITDDAHRARLDRLWMDDYIDADIKGAGEPAMVVLTVKGEPGLARAEQESQR